MKINWIGNDWARVKNHCRTTVNKAFTDKEPTDDFKKKILISEHSPIRCLEIDWTWEDIPYWLSTEWSRHKFEKFITSQRDDRKIEEIPRGKKPQESPVNFDGYANAQNTIDAWRKRLCYKATPEARNLAEIFKYELHKVEPEWADVLQRNCIYRGGCPEFSSCGYWEKFCEKHKGENLLDIETRYRLFNEDFYKSQNIKYAKSIPLLKDGYYQISDVGNLLWFASKVNNGDTSINAVLTADIIVNENVLNADGTLITDFEGLRIWTPIGNESNKYTGTFDGQNHTISGLYFNDKNVGYVGLFGYNSCSTIKNVGVIDSYFNGKDCVGGICGYNYYGTIENSYNTGSVSGSSVVGGVCGYNYSGTIENSYYNNSVYSGKDVGYNYNGTVSKVTGKTSEQFASGEVAYLLGGIWGQEIEKDKLPVLNGKKVYENIIYSGCCKEYRGDVTYDYFNTQKDAVYLKETHNFINGICTVCGTYEPAPLVDNYYQINNAGNLLWFAQQVNNGNKKINGILTADIVVNKNVLNADGTLNTDLTKPIKWTPIGDSSNQYTGTFDGQKHTISGLYFNNSTDISGLYFNNNTDYVGLFGYNFSGTIKNVGIIDSYFKGNYNVGGVCGYNWKGTITNSYNTGSVSGSGWNVGGVCGYNCDGTIENSHNTGSISGSDCVGGVCGYNSGTIKNSYNTGSVSGSDCVGGVCGYNYKSKIENSYNTGSVSGSGWRVGGVCGFDIGTIKKQLLS